MRNQGGEQQQRWVMLLGRCQFLRHTRTEHLCCLTPTQTPGWSPHLQPARRYRWISSWAALSCWLSPARSLCGHWHPAPWLRWAQTLQTPSPQPSQVLRLQEVWVDPAQAVCTAPNCESITAQPGTALPRAQLWSQPQETHLSYCWLINGCGKVVLEGLGAKCTIITPALLLGWQCNTSGSSPLWNCESAHAVLQK